MHKPYCPLSPIIHMTWDAFEASKCSRQLRCRIFFYCSHRTIPPQLNAARVNNPERLIQTRSKALRLPLRRAVDVCRNRKFSISGEMSIYCSREHSLNGEV